MFLITSAKDVIKCPAFVCLFCLFVCQQLYVKVLNGSSLKFNFITDVSVHREELIKFCKSSASGSGYRISFEVFCNIAKQDIFHNLAHISWAYSQDFQMSGCGTYRPGSDRVQGFLYNTAGRDAGRNF